MQGRDWLEIPHLMVCGFFLSVKEGGKRWDMGEVERAAEENQEGEKSETMKVYNGKTKPDTN